MFLSWSSPHLPLPQFSMAASHQPSWLALFIHSVFFISLWRPLEKSYAYFITRLLEVFSSVKSICKFAEKQICSICGSKCLTHAFRTQGSRLFFTYDLSTSTSHHHLCCQASHLFLAHLVSTHLNSALISTEMQLLHLFQSEIFMLPAPTLLLFQCPMSQQVPHCESHVPLPLLYFLWCWRKNPRPWIC